MSADEFTRLFHYMTERFDTVDQQFATQALRFDKLDSLVDQVLKQQEVDDDERLIIGGSTNWPIRLTTS